MAAVGDGLHVRRSRREEIDLALPVSAERQASDYKIYVSFRLTAAELAYNRRTVR